jgi:hypothetical protein
MKMQIKTLKIPDLPHYPMDPLRPTMYTFKVDLFEGEEVIGVNDKEELVLLRHVNAYGASPIYINCHFITSDFDFDTAGLTYKGWVKGKALFVEDRIFC